MKETVRYHGLDVLRAFAMIMGVVLHASMFYVKDIGPSLGYALTGRILIPTSDAAGLIFFFIHFWRMPVFFLLAGFFARLIIEKHGTPNLIKNRFVRIVIPLVAGVIIYNLLFRFGSLHELHHLWFLYDLVWMYVVIVIARFSLQHYSGFSKRFDWFFQSSARLWYLLLFLIPGTVIGRPGFFNSIHTSFGIPGPFFILGILYFFIGWYMHRNSGILEILAGRWRWYLSLGILCFAAVIFILEGMETGKNSEQTTGLLWLIGSMFSSIGTFLIIFSLIGGSQSLFQRPSQFISYAVDASYWIYLLHLVVVFAIAAYILKNTNLNPMTAIITNIILTTLICVATYHVFVRYTPIGWILNGTRKGFIPKLHPHTQTTDK